jgi:hypothetical protein
MIHEDLGPWIYYKQWYVSVDPFLAVPIPKILHKTYLLTTFRQSGYPLLYTTISHGPAILYSLVYSATIDS